MPRVTEIDLMAPFHYAAGVFLGLHLAEVMDIGIGKWFCLGIMFFHLTLKRSR